MSAAVLEERGDVAVGKALARGVAAELPVAQQGDSVVVKADPQCAGLVLEQRSDLVLNRHPIGRNRLQHLVFPTEETAGRSNPEGAVAGRRECRDALIGKAIRCTIAAELAVFPSGEPLVGSDPEGAVGGFKEPADAVAGKAVLGGEETRVVAVDRIESTLAADPDTAIARFVDGADRRLRCEDGVEFAVFELRKRAARADPQAAVASRRKGLNEVVFQRAVIEVVKDGDAHSIVAAEAFLGSEPDIAITGLRYGRHRILGKAVLDGNAGLDVLRNLLWRFEGGAKDTRDQDEQQPWTNGIAHSRVPSKICPSLGQYDPPE